MKGNYYLRTTALLISLLVSTFLSAQQTITGKITNESGSPIAGATIIEVGTNRGALSDEKGEYSIEVANEASLMFRFIGYKPQTVAVENRTVIDIVLETDYLSLDEVVVVSRGYFDVAKEDATGSSSQIRSDQLEKVRANSIESIIQGQAAGVVVSESSEPGGGIGISIRGTNSILGGTQPLYVVDGIPINPTEDAQGNDGAGQAQSNLSFLNPNDIDKVEILKDAAATAIFGARGANGVVIITTKNAGLVDGRNAFNVTVDHTIAQVNNRLGVLDGQQFEGYMNQRFLNQLYMDITDPNRAGIVFDRTQELNAANFPELGRLSYLIP